MPDIGERGGDLAVRQRQPLTKGTSAMCPVLQSTDHCSGFPLRPPYRFVQRYGR